MLIKWLSENRPLIPQPPLGQGTTVRVATGTKRAETPAASGQLPPAISSPKGNENSLCLPLEFNFLTLGEPRELDDVVSASLTLSQEVSPMNTKLNANTDTRKLEEGDDKQEENMEPTERNQWCLPQELLD